MQGTMSRRSFIKVSAAALALAPASAVAVEPFKRPGAPRLLLSLAAYSFRESFKDTNGERKPQSNQAPRIDLFQFVDYCAEHGCTGAELTSYYFPPEVNESFLVKLRRHCFLRGVEIKMPLG